MMTFIMWLIEDGSNHQYTILTLLVGCLLGSVQSDLKLKLKLNFVGFNYVSAYYVY